MSLNQTIISNLESLFLKNYRKIEHASLSQWIDLLITGNPDAFSIDEQKTVKLYDEFVIANFERAKNNTQLLEFYKKTIELNINENEIIDSFSKDLIVSFKDIKRGIKKIEGSKIQIIILTYDFEPCAWISGFGEGKYPILEKPEYFDFNYKKDFFEILGRVDYSKVWSNLIELEKFLQESEIFDCIFETDFYQNLRNAYIYKTYLLLNKAFEKNQVELFSDLNIKKPLFIYGNEHDCEKINIYSYE